MIRDEAVAVIQQHLTEHRHDPDVPALTIALLPFLLQFPEALPMAFFLAGHHTPQGEVLMREIYARLARHLMAELAMARGEVAGLLASVWTSPEVPAAPAGVPTPVRVEYISTAPARRAPLPRLAVHPQQVQLGGGPVALCWACLEKLPASHAGITCSPACRQRLSRARSCDDQRYQRVAELLRDGPLSVELQRELFARPLA